MATRSSSSTVASSASKCSGRWSSKPFIFQASPPPVFQRPIAANADVFARMQLGAALTDDDGTREYGFTDLDGSQPDAWRYVVEVQDPGKPADATGYR